MQSIQSSIIKFVLRRLRVFGDEQFDLQKMRDRTEQIAGFLRPHRSVLVSKVEIDGVASEWLIPKNSPSDRVLLYLHGGAWILGSPKTHRSFVSRLAYASSCRALSIDYRLAPEHPFPAGLEDCVSTYNWLLDNGYSANKIVIAGDSAGGNLTLALLVALRDQGRPLPSGAIAISPVTDLTAGGNSYQSRARIDPVFSKVDSITFNNIAAKYVDSHDLKNPLISPLFANLQGLPAILLHVGDQEILLDDTVRFAKLARDAGVDATAVVWPNMFHVFQIFDPILPESKKANRELTRFIKTCQKGVTA